MTSVVPECVSQRPYDKVCTLPAANPAARAPASEQRVSECQSSQGASWFFHFSSLPSIWIRAVAGTSLVGADK